MHKILIINLGGMGDIILSVPALQALREKYPAARIDFLTARKNAGLIGRWGLVDNEYAVDMGFGGTLSLGAALAACRTIWFLRNIGYDVSVNMRTLYSKRGAAKIRMLCRFIAAKRMLGRNTDGYGFFFDDSITETKRGVMHESQYDAETVALLGARTTGVFSFPVTAQAEKAADAFCAEHGLRAKRFVLWHVGGMPSRRYLSEQVIATIQRLDPSLRVVLTAGGHERAFAESITAGVPSVIDAAGVFGIDALAAMMLRAGAVVSNDTGPMHVAAVLGVPLVALTGAGDLTRFDPRFIEPAATVLHGDVRCAPCEHAACNRMTCMKIIEPAAVAAAITEKVGNAA